MFSFGVSEEDANIKPAGVRTLVPSISHGHFAGFESQRN